jgi:hypothetical protein
MMHADYDGLGPPKYSPLCLTRSARIPRHVYSVWIVKQVLMRGRRVF